MDGKKIMIVDDDKAFLDELRESLSLKGYDPIAINDSTTVLDAAYTSKPDLILLDMNMDRMNGFQVAQLLKRFPMTSKIPIIAMTGVCTRENHLSFMDLCGMEICLEKPFNIIDLILLIKNVLSESHIKGKEKKRINRMKENNDCDNWAENDLNLSDRYFYEHIREAIHPKIHVLLLNSSDAELHSLKQEIEYDKNIKVVDMARNSHEARKMVKNLFPDILIMDILDPKCGGIGFLKRLNHFYPIPVLSVSSMSKMSSRLALSAFRLGVIDFFDKDIFNHLPNAHSSQTFPLTEKIKTLVSRFFSQRSGKNIYFINTKNFVKNRFLFDLN